MEQINVMFKTTIAGIVFTCLSATSASAQLTIQQINNIARQTTVLIAPSLDKEELENLRTGKKTSWPGLGSGVIIAKQGKTYYVLTVAHNFPVENLEKKTIYGIATSDRQVHKVTEIDDGKGCPQSFNDLINTQGARESALVRFGCVQSRQIKSGYDLAIVSFTSDKNYLVASLGDASKVNEGNIVYISGWPKVVGEPKLNADGTPVLDKEGNVVCNEPTPRRQRRLAWGPVRGKIEIEDRLTKEYGYSLFYTDQTRPGMSGGPVFDSNGFVVGIHGQGSGNKPECGQPFQTTPTPPKPEAESVNSSQSTPDAKNPGLEDTSMQKPSANNPYSASIESQQKPLPNNSRLADPEYASRLIEWLKQYNSSAQNVNFSRNLFTQAKVSYPFIYTPPTNDIINRGISQNQQTITTSGRLDNGFDDPNDVIENIYDSFSLQNRLKDCPEGVLIDEQGCNN